MNLNRNINLGAITTVLMGLGLSGCAADAQNANLSEDQDVSKHHMRYVFLNAEEDGNEKVYRLKIEKDEGSEPIVIATKDPESEEFKTAMAELHAQGIHLNLEDLDPASHEVHQFKFDGDEGKKFKFIMKDGPVELDGLKIGEFEEGDEWVSEDGTLHVIKKMEDGKTVLRITREENGDDIILMKESEEEGAHKFRVEKKVIIREDKEEASGTEEAADGK